MHRAGGGASHNYGDADAGALQLATNHNHLLQGRSDEAAQADEIGIVLAHGRHDVGRLYHHAQVDNLAAAHRHHHGDDVLADVVDVALDRGENYAR